MAETKPRRKKAAAAKDEQAPQAKTQEWRGLTLELPDEAPGDLLFCFSSFEEQLEAGQARLTGDLKLLKSLVGSEQFARVQEVVRTEGLSMQQTLEEIDKLVRDLLGQYGMGLGESSASEDS